VSGSAGGEPHILPRAEHPISRRNIAKNAVKVLYRLHNSGFKAYLVGGSVRDLMMGRTPKDYDAGTDARPSEIRRAFRNSRIIGRRFRLVHVFFQDGIVEVATFRREPDPDEQDNSPDELLITNDNAYGTPEQDAFRRDFTVNALFYDISDYSVIDYVGGIRDLEQQVIRTIGDPDVRFREDPVRMLRACEFAGRLGFHIEGKTQEAIHNQREEILKASPARMSEEVVQLLQCGAAAPSIQWMLDLGLADRVVPEVFDMLRSGQQGEDLSRILPVLDEVFRQGEASDSESGPIDLGGGQDRRREVSDGGLLASLLLPRVFAGRGRAEQEKGGPLSRKQIEALVRREIQPFADRLQLSNARTQALVGALGLLQRMCEPGWGAVARRHLAGRRHFRDALFLFDLMARATGDGEEELRAWQRAAQEPIAVQGEDKEAEQRPRRRRRRRRRRKPTGGG
jgi:poly(A) polymerase